MPSLARKITPLPVPETPQARPSEELTDSEMELDLDRLVWDPEYRAEVRAYLLPHG